MLIVESRPLTVHHSPPLSSVSSRGKWQCCAGVSLAADCRSGAVKIANISPSDINKSDSRSEDAGYSLLNARISASNDVNREMREAYPVTRHISHLKIN